MRSLPKILLIAALLLAAGFGVAAVYAPDTLQKVALAAVGALAAMAAVAEIVGLLGPSESHPPQATSIRLSDCGGAPVDLSTQRLTVSTAFGVYFTDLLERELGYIHLDRQISLSTISADAKHGSNYEALVNMAVSHSGKCLFLIAAGGGMGKSTLAARLVRCMKQQNSVNYICGDSAKTSRANPVTGEVQAAEAGFLSGETFCSRLRQQLGLPPARAGMPFADNVESIRARMAGDRAVILVDNLETVENGGELMNALGKLASQDIKVIVTTRRVESTTAPPASSVIVRLNPLERTEDVRAFLSWHIDTYAATNPLLLDLQAGLDNERLKNITRITGGNPLLLQVIASRISISSWDVLGQLPELVGTELLNHLYKDAWNELSRLQPYGVDAIRVLEYVAQHQYSGRKLTTKLASDELFASDLTRFLSALALLQQRFLIVNSDQRVGSLSLVPSLHQFIMRRAHGA